MDSTTYSNLQHEFGKNKILPTGFEKQTLIALSFYPELKNSTIKFRLKKRKTPLESRLSFFSIFRRKENRVFVITISTQTKSFLEPILLKNLGYNAQIGVIGHELSHAADFKTKNFLQTLRIAIGHLAKKYIDRFENATDRRCIEHGLGYQLLSWSAEVREKLNIREWEGADNIKESIRGNETNERYMSPQSIQKVIDNSPAYFTK